MFTAFASLVGDFFSPAVVCTGTQKRVRARACVCPSRMQSIYQEHRMMWLYDDYETVRQVVRFVLAISARFSPLFGPCVYASARARAVLYWCSSSGFGWKPENLSRALAPCISIGISPHIGSLGPAIS